MRDAGIRISVIFHPLIFNISLPPFSPSHQPFSSIFIFVKLHSFSAASLSPSSSSFFFHLVSLSSPPSLSHQATHSSPEWRLPSFLVMHSRFTGIKQRWASELRMSLAIMPYQDCVSVSNATSSCSEVAHCCYPTVGR